MRSYGLKYLHVSLLCPEKITSASFASVNGLLLILDDFLQHLHLCVSLKYLPLNNLVFNLRILPSLSLADFLQGLLGVWVKQDGALRRISKINGRRHLWGINQMIYFICMFLLLESFVKHSLFSPLLLLWWNQSIWSEHDQRRPRGNPLSMSDPIHRRTSADSLSDHPGISGLTEV